MRLNDPHWRTLLAAALSRVLRRTVPPADAAVELAMLDARRLTALDQAMRPGFWEADFLQRPPAILAGAPREEIEACFFAAGCAGSGFLRQRSLSALRNFPGRLALALALIRCDDWVAPVRDEAQSLLRAQLHTQPEALFELLDLLIALRPRQRIGAHAWPDTLLPVLRRPDLSDARRQATLHGSAQARLFAYELIVQTDGPEAAAAARLRAIGNADPAVARWALASCAADSAQDAAVVVQGLRHPHTSVRAEALRRHAQLQLPQTRERILDALADPARGPRGVAAFQARTLLGLDPRRFWRDALDAGDACGTILIQALADCADADDAQRLRPWLDHVNGTVRAAALRGYARTGASDFDARLRAALRDGSTRVLRQAFELCRTHPGVLTRDSLDAAYRRATNASARARLIDANTLLGQWPSLELLLHWLADADEADEARIVWQIDGWLGAQGRRFARLTDEHKARLESTLRRTRASALSWRYAQIEHALKHG